MLFFKNDPSLIFCRVSSLVELVEDTLMLLVGQGVFYRRQDGENAADDGRDGDDEEQDGHERLIFGIETRNAACGDIVVDLLNLSLC